MANAQESSCITGVDRPTAVGSCSNQSRLARCIEGLLEVFRALVRYFAKNSDRASVGTSPEHSSQHANEQILSRETTRTETVFVAGETDSCRASLRKSWSIGSESRKSPRL